MRPLPILSLSLGVVAVTIALFSVLRDTTPPELWFEVSERVPADQPFDLFISASEPSTFRLRYGELALERVSQDLMVSLLALPGSNEITVEVADGAGNVSEAVISVVGVPAVAGVLEAPVAVRAGEPFTAVLSWPDGQAVIREAELVLEGGPYELLAADGHLTLLGAAPLAAGTAQLHLEARLVDEFAREWLQNLVVDVPGGSEPVQELNVPAATLQVVTEDGRVREREALEQAYAQAVSRPLWQEPFLLPIEGRSTSGFALPRRYAPGGPVSYHEGSDIAAPSGTEIRASNRGIVRIADFYPIKGGLVAIDHGMGVFSLYFHQSELLVEVGDEVERGEVIGLVGSTGLSTGPHLHWEMRLGGSATNPLAWVDRTWP